MTVKAALIGHPVSHSKSPLIHNYWIKKHNLKGSYEALDIGTANFKLDMDELIADGYTGFNFTVPHKESAIALCAKNDDLARVLGACNTAMVKGGKLHGTNTDVFGFTENIKQTKSDFDFKAGPAVVLGAGGAARAVIYALLKQGVPEIRLINRTQSKADALAGLYKKIQPFGWGEMGASFPRANILINTTTLGMQGQPPLEIDLTGLPRYATIHDIVYAPLKTALLAEAEERGHPVITGLGMLLHQARPAFKEWFGIMPDIDKELLEAVSV